MAAFQLVTTMTCLILAFSGSGYGGKILLLPIPTGSHYMNFDQMAQALLERGHDVHAYMNHACKKTRSMAALGVKTHTYHNNDGCFYDDEALMQKNMAIFMKDFSFLSLIDVLQSMGSIFSAEIDSFLRDQNAIKALMDVGFDLCIVDGIFSATYLNVIPYKLDIPVIALLAVFNPHEAGVPGLPSFTPHINFGKYTNEMTFMERVHNTLMATVIDAITTSMNPGSSNVLISKYAYEKPYISMAALQRKTRMWLVMSDITLDYPQVRMPHVVDVGGINTHPAHPLPADLKTIADASTDGLIVVSFGSYMTGFPDHLTETLFEAFTQMKQTIIWSYNGAPKNNLPANIHLIKWIPQNDLLAHPNTVLFITHCGANGQFEALYNGIPMLGLPILGDQLYNSQRMIKKGLGIQLDFFTLKSKELVEAVGELLNNGSYLRSMTLHSVMFKDRQQTPMQRLVDSVEHVLKYGFNHLYSPAVNYPWYIYWCVDVAGFLFLVVIVVIGLVWSILKCICKCLCNRNIQKVKEH